ARAGVLDEGDGIVVQSVDVGGKGGAGAGHAVDVLGRRAVVAVVPGGGAARGLRRGHDSSSSFLLREERRRAGCLSSSSESSSSPPKVSFSRSWAPSRAPRVFFLAPDSCMPPTNSGRPCEVPSLAMSRRLTASAKRR